ncbi:PREDICTED: solute carrier family 25 member 45 isoform X2 [Elephantulus edwardii]|uniref:solute carrier family 25 member 45 isoform X2 n=1 Tax=Elephantulus edwardii TaxID=28737 RepID=UPI0003F06CD2|nr:PREDICTED: solute carrier family 25 member 45 isoform X2 [Elephantulus edwardii]
MPVEEFVAGWVSGALGLILGHPFDTIKILGFFKGMSFPIASIAVVNSVLFGVYSNVLLALTSTTYQERRANPPSYADIFIAGCAGGFVQAYCLAPFDLIKVRLQNQTEPRVRRGNLRPRYLGPVHCMTSIIREEGPQRLLRGAGTLMLRDTPTLGIYFVTYEWICRQYTPKDQNPSSFIVLVAGGIAGINSWVTATPLDVIKCRMQMDGMKGQVYRGVLDCMVSSIQREGPRVFFKGLAINSARAFPVNAITFLSYEYFLRWWG